MYRIFVGGLLMEANSFNPVNATREDFTCMLEGKELETLRGTAIEVGGVYHYLEQQTDVEIVPGFYAQACTTGPVRADEFTYLSGRLLDGLKEAENLDGVFLILHGAMQSEVIDDCEGYILSEVRKIVGPDIPICSTFDFHAMMTKEMMQNLDGASSYLTFPHTDHMEAAIRTATCLLELVRTGKRAHKVCHRIPMIMSTENSSNLHGPLVPALHKFRELLAEDGVIGGTFSMAQPWMDSKEMGCSLSAFVLNEEQVDDVSKKLDEILTYIWDKRFEFYPPMPKLDEAMERIQEMKQPVMLVDYGDCPNAGGSCDSSAVLKALLKADLPYQSALMILDEQSTLQAQAVGEGNRGVFQIGGFGKPGAFNERISVEAEVIKVTPDPFVHIGPLQKGYVSKPGMRALVRSGNVNIVLCKQSCYPHDRNLFISMGIDPADMGIISMRSTHSFLSCYDGVYGSWLYVDTPGFSERDLRGLPFERCARPIFPLDEDVPFSLIDVVVG